MSDKIRAEFEAAFPMSTGVFWNEAVGEYDGAPPRHSDIADVHQMCFRAWLAAKEKYSPSPSPDSVPGEAEPVAEFVKGEFEQFPYCRWNEDFQAKPGDRLYLHPPKPAPLQQEINRAAEDALKFAREGDFGLETATARAHIINLANVILSASVSEDKPLPQGLEEFIDAKAKWSDELIIARAVPVDDLRTWMAGKALVPVEFIEVLDNAPYINPSNYDHDQVCDLNTAVREALAMLPQGASDEL